MQSNRGKRFSRKHNHDAIRLVPIGTLGEYIIVFHTRPGPIQIQNDDHEEVAELLASFPKRYFKSDEGTVMEQRELGGL